MFDKVIPASSTKGTIKKIRKLWHAFARIAPLLFLFSPCAYSLLMIATRTNTTSSATAISIMIKKDFLTTSDNKKLDKMSVSVPLIFIGSTPESV